MSISARCDSCGKTYKLNDRFAGRVLACKVCREDFVVPRVGQSGGSSRRSPTSQQFKPLSSNQTLRIIVGLAGIGAVIFVVVIGAAIWKVIDQVNAPASAEANEPFDVAQVPIPQFPELGVPIQTFPGGETVYAVNLGQTAGTNSTPGTWMKMRVYLPAGDHPAASLPCVLVAPAGSNMLVGNHLDGEDYHDETLPYARAGMAVVFYSIDGGVGDLESASDTAIRDGYLDFKAAHAGVVNGRNALEFVLAKLPQVNPARIYSAGHSSAGALSLLLGAHEPRLAGCIAYAPATNLEERMEDVVANPAIGLLLPGIRAFLRQSSPDTHAARMKCPLFVFHAKDDSISPFADSENYVSLTRQAGCDVTLSAVNFGDHYQPMIDEGIPGGINWIRGQLGEQSITANALNGTSDPADSRFNIEQFTPAQPSAPAASPSELRNAPPTLPQTPNQAPF